MKEGKKYPKVNYIGNKEKLSNWICDNIPNDVKSVFDAFSGGCSVSYELKKRGYSVITNDILKINYMLAMALIENNEVILDEDDLNILLSGEAKVGFMTENYSNRLYFKEECMELDLYRENIMKLENVYKQSLAFSLVRRAMIRKMPYSRFNLSWEKILQLRDEDWSYQKYGRKRVYHNESFKSHILKEVEDYNNAIFSNGNSERCKCLNGDVLDEIKR